MTTDSARPHAFLWRDDAHDAPWNMAADETMLQRWAANGYCGLRLYRWEPAAVSIGYFQPHAELVADEPVWVRRPTGGGRVPHDADLTVTLVTPKSHALLAIDRFASYELINATLADALRDVGLQGLSLHPDDIPKSVDRAALVCFETPAKHDVLGPHGKVVGGAQRRTAAGLLHQGSIQLRHYPDLLAEPTPLIDAIALRLATVLAVDWIPTAPAADFLTAAATLAAAKYDSPDWNEKR